MNEHRCPWSSITPPLPPHHHHPFQVTAASNAVVIRIRASITMSDSPLSYHALTRQLAQAKRIISTQQDEIDLLRAQNADQQRRLDQRSADLAQSQRVIQLRIDRLQDECEKVASLLTSPPPSSHPPRLPSWLPPSVALLIREFSQSSSPSVDDRLSMFLIALNKIWKERVDERGKRVAERYKEEVAELKRKLAQRLPYELITQKARILRLQKELDDSRRAYERKRGRRGDREDTSLLDLALSTVENLSAQLIEMEAQNDALKRIINTHPHPSHRHDDEPDPSDDSQSNVV